MAKAKKLPSGSWRCLVYDYTDENGKRKYKSFTSNDPTPSGKREAELLAAQYVAKKEDCVSDVSFSLEQAINEYIKNKSNVLSPTTIRAYKSMQNNMSKKLLNMQIKKIRTSDLQVWVNDLAENASPKTVSNKYSLAQTVIKYFAPDKSFRVQLPQKIKKPLYVPTDDDIRKLIDYIKEDDHDLLIALYLSCFGTLRRSEICGLSADDVSGDTINVNKAMVYTDKSEWIIKKFPKNDSSNRQVKLPEFVVEELPKEGQLVKIKPSTITNKFRLSVKSLGLPDIRFHDLRHYSASVMHAIGVPDVYIMKRGGWSSDYTLKKIYRGEMDDFARKFTEQTNAHFTALNSDNATRNATRQIKNSEK